MTVGVALLVAGVVTFVRQRARIAAFARTTGTVVQVMGLRTGNPTYTVSMTDDGPRVRAKTRQKVRIRFRSADGRLVEFVPSLSTSSRYALGQSVEVLYDARDPQRAQLYDGLHRWFATAMLVGFGFMCLFMGGLSVLLGTVFG